MLWAVVVSLVSFLCSLLASNFSMPLARIDYMLHTWRLFWLNIRILALKKNSGLQLSK